MAMMNRNGYHSLKAFKSIGVIQSFESLIHRHDNMRNSSFMMVQNSIDCGERSPRRMNQKRNQGTFTHVSFPFHQRRFVHTIEKVFVKKAILFPGQGAQFVGMGHDIYEKYQVAKQVYEEANKVLGKDFTKIVFDGPVSELTLTKNAQPDALKLVRSRGEAMQACVNKEETCMKALLFDPKYLDELENIMEKIKLSLPEGQVADLANINSQTQIVLSGTVHGVNYANSIFHAKGMASRAVSLPVSAPFHSSLMLPAQKAMKPHIYKTVFQDPQIDVIANVTARPYMNADEIKTLLVEQISKTVLWENSIRYAQNDGVNEWVLIGPSRVLANLLKKQCPYDIIQPVSSLKEVMDYGKEWLHTGR